MNWLIIILTLVFACFAVVVLVGAPYVPTLSPQVRTALELADLEPGQTMLELGCGDGKVLLAAARLGIKSVGYELNPLLAVIAWARTRRYRQLVTVNWGDFWHATWPPAEAVFVFLLPKYMSKLDTKMVTYQPKPVRLVSFAFEIPNRRPRQIKNGVYLYQYK